MTKEKLTKLLKMVLGIATIIYSAILILANLPMVTGAGQINYLFYAIENDFLMIASVFLLCIARTYIPIFLIICSVKLFKKGTVKPIFIGFIILTIIHIFSYIFLAPPQNIYEGDINLQLYESLYILNLIPAVGDIIFSIIGLVLAILTDKLPAFIFSPEPEEKDAKTKSSSKKSATTKAERTKNVTTIIDDIDEDDEDDEDEVIDEDDEDDEDDVKPKRTKKKQTTKKKQEDSNPKKKAIIRTAIIYSIVAVMMLVIALIGMNEPIILIAGLAAVGITVWIFFTKLIAINRSFCKNCGTNYNYRTDVDWEETEEFENGNALYSIVEFECTCPDCGEVRTFTAKFKTAYFDKNGNLIEKNLTTLVKNYFYQDKK